MNKKIIALLLITFLGVALYLSFKLRMGEAEDIKESGIDTIGTIENVGWKTIDISYSLFGKRHLYTENKPYKGITTGEEFFVRVKKSDYNRVLVYYSKPFLDTVKFHFATIKPKDVDITFENDDAYEYTYIVNSNEITRIQKFYGNNHPKNLNKLLVKYRIDKPEIGYLVEE